MTKKLTPLERKRMEFLDALDDQVKESEKTHQAVLDPSLSPDERLDLFMALQAWPRIVLGLYEAESAIARKQKKQNPTQEHGEPSDTAYDVVGAALGLGPDRIRDLCREGRRHVGQGMPRKLEIRAAEFVEKYLRGRATPRRKRKKQRRKP